MANKRKSMRKIRQVLRLAWEAGLGGWSGTAADCPQSVDVTDHGGGVPAPCDDGRAQLATARSMG